MRLEIPKKISSNCHVVRLGYRYPIIIQGEKAQYKALHVLYDTFQEPTRELYYCIDYNIKKPKLKEWWNRPPFSNSRWFLDTKKWGIKEPYWRDYTEFWAVFRTEKDQICAASMLLNEILDGKRELCDWKSPNV